MLSPKSRRRKRRVKFNKVVHNRRIPHLNDLSEEEVFATWIQPEEYLAIRSRCIVTAKKMMRGLITQEDLDSGKHEPRGLEGKTKEGGNARREHKMDSIAAVLEEQTLQWNEDVFDEDAIRDVYSCFSIGCADDAHRAALQDAAAAHSYLYQEHSPVAEAKSSTSQHEEEEESTALSPVSETAAGVVDRLKDIFFLRSSKAALLSDIENLVYNEAAMERRRKVYEKPNGNALASQLRQYFSAQGGVSATKGSDEQDVPSLASSQYSDSTEDDSSSNSSHVEDDVIASSDSFTSQLHTHFSSRKKRQALLQSIERGFFEETETAIVTVSSKPSPLSVVDIAPLSVSSISSSVGSLLDGIFHTRSKRKAVVDELRASAHLRQL